MNQSESLAEHWFGSLVDLANAEQFRTDMDVMDEELLALFREEIHGAVEGLKESLLAKDLMQIRGHAHSLQGMGGAAGAPEISLVGLALSDAAKAEEFERLKRLIDALAGWEIGWRGEAQAATQEETIPASTSIPTITGRVLVVDDEKPNREFLRQLLESAGAEVVLAEDGEQGLEILGSHHPDVALVDVMMPGMNGYEVCQAVKSNEAMARTAVIMVTARTTVEDIEYGFELGAFDYIRKPFRSRELLARVQNALQLKRQKDALQLWKDTLSRELKMAGTLQQRVLNPYPFIGQSFDLRFAYSPCRHIGGDLFDVVGLEDGKVFGYVADVAGHGVASALVSTMLKSVLFEGIRMHPEDPLEEIGCFVHLRFRELITDPELYATGYLFRLDPQTREFECLNCGHPLPLVMDTSGNELLNTIPDVGGMPIGMFPEGMGDAYLPEDVAKVAFPEGAMFVICTDGLLEARDANGEECGREEWVKACSRHLPTDVGLGDPEEILKDMSDAGYALEEDDCSMLQLQLLPPERIALSGMSEVTTMEADRVSADLEKALTDGGWSAEDAAMVRLVSMEHLMNVVNHGEVPEGMPSFHRLTVGENSCRVCFRDSGVKWNQALQRRRHLSREEDGTRESGRGLLMMERICSDVEAYRREHHNYTLYEVEKNVAQRIMETMDE